MIQVLGLSPLFHKVIEMHPMLLCHLLFDMKRAHHLSKMRAQAQRLDSPNLQNKNERFVFDHHNLVTHNSMNHAIHPAHQDLMVPHAVRFQDLSRQLQHR